MIFAKIGHGSCYYHWNEIFAGVGTLLPANNYAVHSLPFSAYTLLQAYQALST